MNLLRPSTLRLSKFLLLPSILNKNAVYFCHYKGPVFYKKPSFNQQKPQPWTSLLPNNGSIRNYEQSSDWQGLIGSEYLNLLTDSTIESFLRDNESVLVMFYAPWCHHCKGAKPEFAKAAYALHKEMPSAKLAAIDCMVYPTIYEKYEVTGYPTIKYFRYGTLIGEYHHRRRAMDFVHFMLRSPKTKGDM